MAKAFYYLRTTKSKQPQIIYLGLRHGTNQIVVSTGIKVLPKHYDLKKSEIKKDIVLPVVDLPTALLAKCTTENLDIASFVNDYLHRLAKFTDSKRHLTSEALKIEIKGFINGRNNLEQFSFDLDNYVKSCLSIDGMTKGKLIELIETYLHPAESKTTLFEYIEKVILESTTGRRLKDGQKFNERTIQRYRTTQQLLKDFQSVYDRIVDFETIDLDFYKDFTAFMVSVKDYKPATLGKHVSTLKTFLHEATEEGINSNLKFQSKTFKAVEAESDSIYLTATELTAMYNLNLTDNPRLDKVRDLFLIGCWTGLRFSDFTTIKPHNLKKVEHGYNLEIIQYKTKGKVIIPVDETVLAIMAKYDNVLPVAISNQKFNEYIKEIAQQVPALQALETRVFVKGGKECQETTQRWELVTTHTARRSFATNAYKRGTASLAIMAITGHQTEKSFMKYIKVSKSEQAEIVRKNQK